MSVNAPIVWELTSPKARASSARVGSTWCSFRWSDLIRVGCDLGLAADSTTVLSRSDAGEPCGIHHDWWVSLIRSSRSMKSFPTRMTYCWMPWSLNEGSWNALLADEDGARHVQCR